MIRQLVTAPLKFRPTNTASHNSESPIKWCDGSGWNGSTIVKPTHGNTDWWYPNYGGWDYGGHPFANEDENHLQVFGYNGKDHTSQLRFGLTSSRYFGYGVTGFSFYRKQQSGGHCIVLRKVSVSIRKYTGAAFKYLWGSFWLDESAGDQWQWKQFNFEDSFTKYLNYTDPNSKYVVEDISFLFVSNGGGNSDSGSTASVKNFQLNWDASKNYTGNQARIVVPSLQNIGTPSQFEGQF